MASYPVYVTNLAKMLTTEVTNTKFVELLPVIINAAEQRIYRELDFLAQRTYRTIDLVALTRTRALPVDAPILVVLESAFVITPAATNPDVGKRNPLRRVSPDLLDFISPSLTDVPAGLPTKMALDDAGTARFAPTPDAAYKVELRGTYRPAPLAALNPDTYLTTNYYDLFFAASMVMGSAYQKNFGAQADDPKMALTWEGTYEKARASAEVEALRQKGEGAAWGPKIPSPLAQPPRT